MAGPRVRPAGRPGPLAGPLIAAAVAGVIAGCGTGGGPAAPSPATTGPAPGATTSAAAPASPSATPTAAATPLAGQTVGIDPGHNGGNGADPAFINSIIWNGRASETCDTTGTATDSGYTEAAFNWNVARYLTADLTQAGARVVLTRHSNTGVGPCVTTRARILNRAGANVAIDIHADGGPAWGRGFTVLEPVADGPNNGIIGASQRLGRDVRAAMLKYTGMPVSNYYGGGGVIFRNDLAGLNLATEPKVLIECGNMRNATDASLLTAPRFQRRVAKALAAAIAAFLGAGH
jgi:N-acetylmuramoyl-L-alanine amidase